MPAAAAARAAGAAAAASAAAPDDSVARNLGQGGRSVNDLHRLLVKRLCSAASEAWDKHVGKRGPVRSIPMKQTILMTVRILTTGMQWYQLESTIGSWQLHYSRFRKLSLMGVFENDFQTAGREYVTLKGSLARLLIDATHIKARKGGPCVGPSPVDRGKNGSKLTVLADEESVPLCAIFSAGNVSDTIQLPTILETARKQYGNLSQFRELLADKGYDSAANRAACRRHGLLPRILKRRPRRNLPVAAPGPGVAGAPRRRNPRRGRRGMAAPRSPPPAENQGINACRWAVERVFAWQDNYRRVIMREERNQATFKAMQFLSLSAIIYKKLEAAGITE